MRATTVVVGSGVVPGWDGACTEIGISPDLVMRRSMGSSSGEWQRNHDAAPIVG